MEQASFDEMAGINWAAIKTEYLTTKTSYRKLAEKYGVHKDAIGKRAKAEGWQTDRQMQTDRVTTKTLEKIADKEADRLARLIDATTRAIDVAMEAFEDDKQFNRYLVEKKEQYAVPQTEENGETVTVISERQWVEEQTFSKVDTKALKDLTGILKDLTRLMRDFYNIPTPAQAAAQKLAAERFELDKRRLGEGEEEGDETGVVLMPPVLEGEDG